MTELPCPTCGSELAFFEQYNRFYCHRCQRYAPEGYGAKGARKCPTCGGVLSYVTQYDRFYCYRCNSYAPVEAEPSKAEAPMATEPTPTAEPAPIVEPAPTMSAVAAAEAVATTSAPAAPTTPAPGPETPMARAEPAAMPKPIESAQAAPAGTAVVAAAKPEPAPEQERPRKPDVKPAVLRLRIFTMRKAELSDLCRAYELDPTGTKDDLQERLLDYLKRLEAAEEEGEEEPEEPAPVVQAAAKEPEPEAEAAAVMTIQEPATAAPEPLPVSAAAPVVIEPEAPSRPAIAAPIPVVATPIPVTVAPHVEHPCPTCGRELSFISQYGRWYCYSCQHYAPATKNACPNCGATMRFIDQYDRWWCDSCRRYGPADLPKPRTATVSAVTAPATQAVSATAVVTRAAPAHGHGNPSSGIALLAFGIMLYVAYAALAVLPQAVGYKPPALLGPADLALLNFLAFLLMAIGAVVGLTSLRHRE